MEPSSCSGPMPGPGDPMNRLLEIMARLRGPDGCPWDREQTLETLKPYLIEESYEVLEAMDSGSPEALCEELGDLLLQIVFQSQLCSEAGNFTFQDVASGIGDKLVRRHPHVFESAESIDSAAVIKNWDAIKKKEKAGRSGSAIDGIPRSLPGLARAREVQKRVARSGFDWTDAEPVRAKVEEEWQELAAAVESGKPERIREEFGDLLFSMVNLSRFLNLDAEEELRRSIDKFSSRYGSVETFAAESGRSVSDCTAEELNSFWEKAKAEEG